MSTAPAPGARNSSASRAHTGRLDVITADTGSRDVVTVDTGRGDVITSDTGRSDVITSLPPGQTRRGVTSS